MGVWGSIILLKVFFNCEKTIFSSFLRVHVYHVCFYVRQPYRTKYSNLFMNSIELAQMKLSDAATPEWTNLYTLIYRAFTQNNCVKIISQH